MSSYYHLQVPCRKVIVSRILAPAHVISFQNILLFLQSHLQPRPQFSKTIVIAPKLKLIYHQNEIVLTQLVKRREIGGHIKVVIYPSLENTLNNIHFFVSFMLKSTLQLVLKLLVNAIIDLQIMTFAYPRQIFIYIYLKILNVDHQFQHLIIKNNQKSELFKKSEE